MRAAALTALSVLTLTLVPVSAASAADPGDTIGGTLSATGSEITLRADGTLPVAVEMAADGPFSVIPAAFVLQPGETATLTVEGNPSGRVLATLRGLTVGPGDSSSLTLSVGFPKPAPPPSPVPYITLTLLTIAGIAFLLWRVRPWRYRIVRTDSPKGGL